MRRVVWGEAIAFLSPAQTLHRNPCGRDFVHETHVQTIAEEQRVNVKLVAISREAEEFTEPLRLPPMSGLNGLPYGRAFMTRHVRVQALQEELALDVLPSRIQSTTPILRASRRAQVRSSSVISAGQSP